jgi:peptidoglycan/xylan/chitin deacetylase (PgdA/CDA1 family)
VERIRSLLKSLRPHPSAIYDAIENDLPPITDFVTPKQLGDRYAGLTEEQIAELAADPLFTIGGHTCDHPFLSDCSLEEVERQIRENLEMIGRITGRKHDTVAYPSGDYDDRVLRVCSELDISAGFAVSPKFGRRGKFEIPRMGVYNVSEAVLGFKVQWGNYLRAARLAIG